MNLKKMRLLKLKKDSLLKKLMSEKECKCTETILRQAVNSIDFAGKLKTFERRFIIDKNGS